MRKISSLALSLLFIVAAFTSCKKIKDAIFSGVDVAIPDISVPVPAIPPIVVPFEIPMGPYSQNFNLDSAIRANTGGAFGIGVVTSIKLKTFTVKINNADDNNNLSNFESARVMLSSNSQTTPVELVNLNFPTTNISTLTVTSTNSPDLLPYLRGGQLNYQIVGKARRATSKQLDMVVSAVMTVK